MSRRLEDLAPDVERMCRALLEFAAKEGEPLGISQTLRTWEEQDALYAQGRTTKGRIVTWARGGFSWHNFGRAFDIYSLGKEPYPKDDDWWEMIGEMGEDCGLEWGGRWKSAKADRPHFEHHGGMTLAQARIKHLSEPPTA